MIDRRDRSPAPSLVYQCLPRIFPLSLPAQRPEGGPRAGSRRLDLDVVRGVAIVLALGWHFSRNPSGNPVLDALQWPGRTFGWAGVDLFFVLSGFLMGQLVLRERARTGGFDGRRFTARRLLRLWPVLYVFLAVHAVLGTEPVGSYLLAERPPRAELRGDVAGAPVVARGRGALLPPAGRPLPAVRPAPPLPAPAGGGPRRRPRRLAGAAGHRRRDRGQRGAAAVADALPHGLARRRRAARRPPGARPGGVRAPRRAAPAVGRGDEPPASASSPSSARTARWGARWATRSPT